MNIDDRIASWNDRVNGPQKIGGKFRKLGEEVGELGEALMALDFSSDSSENDVLMEIADCAIVLSHLARLVFYHQQVDTLEGLMTTKMKILEQRVPRGTFPEGGPDE
jgi:NTP pyrophosphatase (non-canonical NTP hydrolase)